MTDDGEHIKSVIRAFEIIDTLQETDIRGATDLAAELDVPKSTAHVYLKTLKDAGYVVEHGETYRPSLRFLETGGEVRQDINIFHAARSELDALAQDVNEVVNLGYAEDGKRVLLYTVEPERGIFDNAPVGQFTDMHWTALGKSLLMQMPDEEIDAALDWETLPEATENTITDRDALFEEIETSRERGYTIEDEEHWEGIMSIAVPVEVGAGDHPPSAISISGPKRRLVEKGIEESLLGKLRDAANVIQLKQEHY